MHSLAIVVPAYKKTFLREVLDSIARQTDQNFTLYIGDDHSPENLQDICAEFETRINLNYIRYEENWGGKDLPAHWERCIDESQEPYIWLFSDDDVMPEDAVQRINAAIREKKRSFYRFPLSITDEQLNVVYNAPAFRHATDTAESFLNEKFSGERPSAAIEFVFCRELYEKGKKFVHFPVAWSSDDATWFRYAFLGEGIVNLPGKAVCWRQSGGTNISTNPALNQEKMNATTRFMTWLRQEMTIHDMPCTAEFLRNLKKYIKTVLTISLNKKFSTKELVCLCRALAAFDRKLAFQIFLKYFV